MIVQGNQKVYFMSDIYKIFSKLFKLELSCEPELGMKHSPDHT